MVEVYNRPDVNLGIYDATNNPAYSNLIQNPYFIQALGGLAEGLDPQGVGGALGRAGTAFSKSRQGARANAIAISDENKRNKALIDLLRSHGGLTPQGEPGPYAVSVGKDNTVTMKINPDLPAPEVKPPPQAPNRDVTSSVPTAPLQERSGYNENAPSPMELAPPEAVRRQNLGPVPATNIGPIRSRAYSTPLSSVIPFYQAPLRSQRRR